MAYSNKRDILFIYLPHEDIIRVYKILDSSTQKYEEVGVIRKEEGHIPKMLYIDELDCLVVPELVMNQVSFFEYTTIRDQIYPQLDVSDPISIEVFGGMDK